MDNSYGNMPEIPAEKFKFAEQKEDNISLPKRKAVGFWQDAFRRFAKNSASIVALAILVILVAFAILVPIFSRYNLSDRDGNYSKVLPKLTKSGSGFWDGSRGEEINERNFDYYTAMGVESGKSPILKVTKEKNFGATKYYTVRLDSYYKVGYKYINLSLQEYLALEKYQDENNLQVLYPYVNTALSFDGADANFWYKTDARGSAEKDVDGNYISIYLQSDSSTQYPSYDSLRLENDDGSWVYAVANQTGYSVRVCYYDYYIYLHGFEPLFPFGTNGAGADILVSLALGARFSLSLAVCISLINFALGAIYGAIEGYYGGTVDLTMERIRDILSGVPFIIVVTLFSLHLAGKVGTIPSLLFAFVTTGWIGLASTTRSQFYRFKNQEYVLAVRTLGARDRRIIWKHIFPNTLGTLITKAVLLIPSVIFSESILSYLGIVNFESAGYTSIGTLLSGGQQYISTFPHIVLFPALFLSLIMISFNLLGNGLRDAFNPTT